MSIHQSPEYQLIDMRRELTFKTGYISFLEKERAIYQKDVEYLNSKLKLLENKITNAREMLVDNLLVTTTRVSSNVLELLQV